MNAIRYVDEVVRMDTLDKAVSWSKKHYHLLFIGDDWKGDDRWIETEKEMAQYGVKVVYLPYTRTTSSSIIRQKLLSY